MIVTHYQVGTDAKTVAIAASLNAQVEQAMDSGDFVEAERVITAALASPNRPLRAELKALGWEV